MPFIRVWIHFVWSVKDRHPLLSDEIRPQVFRHIRENALEKGIHLDFINGYRDHAHCLVSLGADQTLEKLMQLIKGESSYWINKNNLCRTKFAWQDEYFAASVSESLLENARKYIARQEDHHKSISFDDEFEDFLERAGFERLKDRTE